MHQKNITFFVVIGAVVIAFGLFFWQMFRGTGFFVSPFSGGETMKETIVIRDGEVVGTREEVEMREMPSPMPLPPVEEVIPPQEMVKRKGEIMKEIMVTNGVRHSVPLDEILGGGPPKDGIPSIDEPKFITQKEANEWLDDSEPGIAFSRGNAHRFYPYQILVWHEIVNDTVGGQRILVTYCPLCLTGFVFDPVVKGERVEFGTSGKLWNSNLVMYDRKTDSYWSQILGEAIRGEMTGTKLKLIESDQMRYGEWKKAFPNGEVLSRDTGALRFYGENPYGGYFSVTDFSLQLVKGRDDRLPNDAFVFGVVVDGRAKAYHVDAIKREGIVEDVFKGTTFVLDHDKALDVVRMFKKLPNGQRERVNPFSSFWFSWAAVHPETELYK